MEAASESFKLAVRHLVEVSYCGEELDVAGGEADWGPSLPLFMVSSSSL